mgnify:CR=1 FL=1
METIEASQAREGQAGSAGNIGKVLERIVQTPAQAPNPRKKLVFPSESVSASDFRIPQPGEARPAKKTNAPSRTDASVQQTEAQNVTPVASPPPPASAPPSSPQVERRPAQPAQTPQPARKAQARRPTPSPAPAEKKKKVVAKARPKEQVRRKDETKKVLLEKSERTVSKDTGASTEVDLETFMRDAEKTEEREIRCRPQTLALLEQIALRTGSDSSDVAVQAVTSVAQAIQEAGFTFCLPMQAELKPRKK